MDILDQLGALVMYWGRGCDAGATLPAVDEASALTREATSAEIIGEPLADIERAALASPELIKFAAGAPVKRVVVVPGRLVNVVL